MEKLWNEFTLFISDEFRLLLPELEHSEYDEDNEDEKYLVGEFGPKPSSSSSSSNISWNSSWSFSKLSSPFSCRFNFVQ